jgi:hypothetical protein
LSQTAPIRTRTHTMPFTSRTPLPGCVTLPSYIRAGRPAGSKEDLCAYKYGTTGRFSIKPTVASLRSTGQRRRESERGGRRVRQGWQRRRFRRPLGGAVSACRWGATTAKRDRRTSRSWTSGGMRAPLQTALPASSTEAACAGEEERRGPLRVVGYRLRHRPVRQRDWVERVEGGRGRDRGHVHPRVRRHESRSPRHPGGPGYRYGFQLPCRAARVRADACRPGRRLGSSLGGSRRPSSTTGLPPRPTPRNKPAQGLLRT